MSEETASDGQFDGPKVTGVSNFANHLHLHILHEFISPSPSQWIQRPYRLHISRQSVLPSILKLSLHILHHVWTRKELWKEGRQPILKGWAAVSRKLFNYFDESVVYSDIEFSICAYLVVGSGCIIM